MKLLLLLLLATASGGGESATTPLGCRDQNNNIVDWYVLYKLPILTGNSNPLVARGKGYLYFSSESSGFRWSLSAVGIDALDSHPALTLAPVYENPQLYAYVFYNDAPPPPTKRPQSGSRWGHTKGVLATDGTQGFWMIHSVPKFPLAPGEGNQYNYSYVESGYRFGQTFLCMTLIDTDRDGVQKAFQQVLQNDAFIYAAEHVSTLRRTDSVAPSLSVALSPQTPSQVNEIWQIIYTMSGHHRFISFAKDRLFKSDLYSHLVAPTLGASLLVEAYPFASNDSNRLPSFCDDRYHYVENVLNVTVSARVGYQYDTFSFGRTKDHSKWAVSKYIAKPWVCIGDINRAMSQFYRGGGTACIWNEKLWEVFRYSVPDSGFEKCP